MTQDISAPNGPVEVELKIYITDGKRTGVATVGMGFGGYPSKQDITDRLEKFAQEELPQVAPGYRLMTAPELWDTACMKTVGQTFALPAHWQAFHPIA